LLQAVIGMIQGVGGDAECVNETRVDPINGTFTYEIVAIYPDPRFGVGVFFGIISGLLAASLGAFLVLHFHSSFAKERTFSSQNPAEYESKSDNQIEGSVANSSEKIVAEGNDNVLKSRNIAQEDKNLQLYTVNQHMSRVEVPYIDADFEADASSDTKHSLSQDISIDAQSLSTSPDSLHTSHGNNKTLFTTNKVAPESIDPLSAVQGESINISEIAPVLYFLQAARIAKVNTAPVCSSCLQIIPLLLNLHFMVIF